MNKLFRYCAFLICTVVCFQLSASTSATIELSATAPQAVSISLSDSGYDFGDISTSSTADELLATININSNAINGWQLILSNTNSDFKLTSSTDEMPYSLKYNGTAVTYSSSIVLDSDDGSEGATLDMQKNLNVTLSSDDALNAGSYNDTITLEIVAN